MNRSLVISDLHVPFHDDSAIEVVYDMLRDIKFENFVINGDLIDGWELSRFSKDPRSYVSFGVIRQLFMWIMSRSKKV